MKTGHISRLRRERLWGVKLRRTQMRVTLSYPSRDLAACIIVTIWPPNFCCFCREHLAQPRRTAACEVCPQTVSRPHSAAFERTRGSQSQPSPQNLHGKLPPSSKLRVFFVRTEFWRGKTTRLKSSLHVCPI